MKPRSKQLVVAGVTQASHGFVVGEPIYYTGSAWAAAKADANTTTADAVVTSASTNAFTYIQAGILTLTTGEWDARSGETGGLTAGEHYVLDQDTAGKITKTAPGSGIVQYLSRALSTTQALISVGAPHEVGDTTGTIGVLSTTAIADAKSETPTAIHTVPLGGTVIVTGVRVRVTEATSITVGPSASVGVAGPDYDDLIASQTLSGLLDTADVYGLTNAGGLLQSAAALDVIYFDIDTGATGTSMALEVDLLGYDLQGAAPETTVGILSSTAITDAKVETDTDLYTVPAGKTAVITEARVRVSEATSISVAPSAGIGVAAGFDDIIASQALTNLLTTTAIFALTNAGGLHQAAAAASVVKFDIDTGATGTSMALVVDLLGYLVPA